MPCHPACKGLDAFDNGRAPAGYVEIQRCDECDRYRYDETAACLVSSRGALWVDLDDPEATHPIPPEASELGEHPLGARDVLKPADRAWSRWRSVACVVPVADAIAFGLRCNAPEPEPEPAAERSLGALRCPECGGETISLWCLRGETRSCGVDNGRLILGPPDGFDNPDRTDHFSCDDCGHDWPVPEWIQPLIEW
jgi:hypothetical protein